MTTTAPTAKETKLKLLDQLAYILDNTEPDSEWRQTVEYAIEATFELVREDQADFGRFI